MAINYQKFLISPSEEGLQQAASLLRSGQLLAFPTETVYGLGADATNEEAVLSIFRAKGRPLTDPLIVHVATPSDADSLIDVTTEEQQIFTTLSAKFWPGPLTQIVKASSRIPLAVTANTGFVGIRCPNHPLALALLQRAQVPVAAPSANRFGHVSPTRAIHVLADLAEKGVMVLDGEETSDQSCEFGIESTVIKLEQTTREIVIFRQGAVTQHELESTLRSAGIDWTIRVMVRAVKMHSTATPSTIVSDAATEGQVAPGQAITHYAPDVPAFILKSIASSASAAVSTDVDSVDSMKVINLSSSQCQSSVVIIDYAGQYSSYQEKCLAYRELSSTGNAAEGARGLFDALRWAELIPHARYVLIAPVGSAEGGGQDTQDMSLGLADRVFRAASGVQAVLCIADLQDK